MNPCGARRGATGAGPAILQRHPILCPRYSEDPAMPIVETAHGRILGRDLPAGGAAFTGIPFAAPPVGSGRLRPPAPVEPWGGELDATLVPAAPMQDSAALGAAE